MVDGGSGEANEPVVYVPSHMAQTAFADRLAELGDRHARVIMGEGEGAGPTLRIGIDQNGDNVRLVDAAKAGLAGQDSVDADDRAGEPALVLVGEDDDLFDIGLGGGLLRRGGRGAVTLCHCVTYGVAGLVAARLAPSAPVRCALATPCICA